MFVRYGLIASALMLVPGMAKAAAIITLTAQGFPAAAGVPITPFSSFGVPDGTAVSSIMGPAGVVIGFSGEAVGETVIKENNIPPNASDVFNDSITKSGNINNGNNYAGDILVVSGDAQNVNPLVITANTSAISFEVVTVSQSTNVPQYVVYGASSDQYSMYGSTINTNNKATNPNSLVFVGTYDLAPGQSVTIAEQGVTTLSGDPNGYYLGNFQVGPAFGGTPVTEPASFAMLAAGLAGLTMAAGRRKRG